MKITIALCAVLAYNLTLLAGCSYLVFWKGASPWWFVAVVLLHENIKIKNLKL